jgi:hypothetical protein
MAKFNSEKTISANSNGMLVSYRDSNKTSFVKYEVVEKIQLSGIVRYQKMVKHFTPQQKELYQKVVYGFKAYTPEQVASMSEKTKIDVTVTYTKAKRVLTKWKQEIIFTHVNSLLAALFPKSNLVKQMIDTNGSVEEDAESFISFKQLGIDQEKIAEKLIEFGLLPKNFFQLG